MGPPPGQVGDKPDAAGVVLELAVIQSLITRAPITRGSRIVPGEYGGSPPRTSTAGNGEAARRAASRVT
jgi:hypothetical protein